MVLLQSVQFEADFEMLGYIRQQSVLLSQQQQQQKQQQQNPADNKEDMGAPETGDMLDDIGSDEVKYIDLTPYSIYTRFFYACTTIVDPDQLEHMCHLIRICTGRILVRNNKE
jgi:hypothetical protein